MSVTEIARLRWLLSVLLIAGAALFAVGVPDLGNLVSTSSGCLFLR